MWVGEGEGGLSSIPVRLLARGTSSVAHRFAYEGGIESGEAEGLHGGLKLHLSHKAVSVLRWSER